MKALHLKKNPEPQAAQTETMAKRTKAGGHGITIVALTLALGAAVYLNWSFSQDAPLLTAGDTAQGGVSEVTADAPEQAGESVAVYDALGDTVPQENTAEQNTGKNYGEAQLVSANQDSGTEFFEQARLTRSKARDEALQELETALKRADLTQEEKDGLTARLSSQLAFVTKESDLETLIKAKGFADCVVMLSADGADVTVMTENDALTAGEVTQIRDVVLSRCPELNAQSIKVVEVR